MVFRGRCFVVIVSSPMLQQRLNTETKMHEKYNTVSGMEKK